MSNPTDVAPVTRAERITKSVYNRAQDVVKEDVRAANLVAKDAAKSGSYLYPIKGIFFFATHRALWKPLLSKLVPYLTLSISVTALMFAFTYLPQMAVLVFVDGPLAVITTPLLILNESSTIVNLLSRNWLLEDALLDTFDGTLAAKNATALLQSGRQVTPGSDPIGRLGKLLKKPFSFDKFGVKAFVRYLLHLPLNFIPIVGTVLFLFTQGRARGQTAHGRYFQLKGWTTTQMQSWMKTHAGPYTAFGVVASLLETLPFVNVFFTFTNTVGAALWAIDMEDQSTQMTTAPPDFKDNE